MWFNATCAASTSTGATSMLFASLVTSLIDGACKLGEPDLYPPDRSFTSHQNNFDFVIVGGGTAGSVLAARLSELPQYSVAVLEAGGNPPSESDVPAFSHDMQQTKYDWQYRTQPQHNALFAFNDQRSVWPLGKMLGGSSSHNTMLYVRGNRRDFDNWAAKGNQGWDYESVLPYFKKSEDIQIPELQTSPYHGRGGPMPVSYFDYKLPLEQALLDSASEMGHSLIDYNGAENNGYYRMQVTAFNGTRFGPARAFLGPAKDRENLHVFKNSHVTRIVFENKRPVGVIYIRDGINYFVKALKEVIICAGTLNSPQLLMLSGIGPQEHLLPLGIPVVHNSPGMGSNLQDHVINLGQVVSITPQRRVNPLDAAHEYFLHRKGPLSSLGILSIGGFIC